MPTSELPSELPSATSELGGEFRPLACTYLGTRGGVPTLRSLGFLRVLATYLGTPLGTPLGTLARARADLGFYLYRSLNNQLSSL
jgi:hypothetical protein